MKIQQLWGKGKEEENKGKEEENRNSVNKGNNVKQNKQSKRKGKGTGKEICDFLEVTFKLTHPPGEGVIVTDWVSKLVSD